jgi:hypothetical protein
MIEYLVKNTIDSVSTAWSYISFRRQADSAQQEVWRRPFNRYQLHLVPSCRHVRQRISLQ